MSYRDPKPGDACRVCGFVSKDFRQRACVNCSIVKGVYRKYGTGQGEAHRLVAREIKAGRLPRLKNCVCADCGKPAAHYEHRNYNKPLVVEPVCRACNTKRGSAIPKTMTFAEFVAAVRKDYPHAVAEHFEMLQQLYWPEEGREKK